MERADHLSSDGDQAADSSGNPSVQIEWDATAPSSVQAPTVSSLVGPGSVGRGRRVRRAPSRSPTPTAAPLVEVAQPETSGSPRLALSTLAILLALGGAAFVASVGSEGPGSAAVVSPTTTIEASTTSSTSAVVVAPRVIESAPPAPPEWLASRHLAFIDGEVAWTVIDLEIGEEIATPGFYDFLLPPLDQGAVLVNSPNRAYAIDPSDPGASGQLSNRVAMARVSGTVTNQEQFGFVEHTDRGIAEITVNSLWAPTLGPIIEAPRDSTIIVVDRRGILISQSNGDSFVVEDDALVRVVPSTIGTVFAATEDAIIGRSCRDGDCVGVVADWNFDVEYTVALDPLTSTAAISPDGLWLASHLTSGFVEVMSLAEASADFPSSTTGRRLVPALPDSELVWSLDSALLSWFSAEMFVATDVTDPALRVRAISTDGQTILAGSSFFVS